MKISALVTTYRRFDKCCRAIDAILRQTHPVDEVIVVDNASPEPEYAGLHDRYAGAAVPVNVVRLSRGTHTQKPFRDDAGREISTASRDTMNVAQCLARGDWFAYCHDDDEWMPHRIARQIEALRANPGCLLMNASVINRTEGGECLGVHHDYYGTHGVPATAGVTDVTECVPRFNPMAVSALLASRHLIATVGGWQRWVPDDVGRHMRSLSASDWDLYRRASTVTRLLRVDEPLVFYEVNNVKHEGHECHA
jgi:glycosyltransferase involved in cell wall biosynthesis